MKFIQNIINNMKINMKLGLILGLPLIGMLILATLSVSLQLDNIHRYAMLESATQLSVNISALVHEMQKERGASAGYIGSGGAKFSTILSEQRRQTDQALNALRQTLKDFDFSSLTREGADGVKAYLRSLEDIGNKRSMVKSLNISVADAVAWYTGRNNEGLGAITEQVHTGYDPDLTISADLTAMLASYILFLQSKERAGIERALLSGAFASDELMGKKRDKVLKMICLQEGYTLAFKSLAEDDLLELYDKHMNEPGVASAVAEVGRLRALALGQERGYGVNPEHWFKTITIKINALHKIEVEFADDLVGEASEAVSIAREAMWRTVIISGIMLVLVGLLALMISRGITGPLKGTMKVLPLLADGDLTQQITAETNDEFGELDRYLSTVFGNMQVAIKAIAGNAQTLAGASEELTSVSQQMGANAEETSAQANVVSEATGQINENIQTVATGIEELAASTGEIASNATDAAKVANEAVNAAGDANQTISRLDASSSEIGEIIKTITSIAQQTRLLALNATIEAARAGEAGKGFAVVANEVKDLAMGTAKASDDISQKIEVIQADSKAAVDAIAHIGEIITRINEFQNTIASAVDEQNNTTSEIARNVNDAARGSAEIAENIGGVAEAAQSTSTGANDTQQASAELSRMAAELQQLVGQFKYE
jgi:methyl-accepting chemotaxis protein